MDALLMDAWMAGADSVPTIDGASASLVRETVRSRGAALGLSEEIVACLAIAASELVNNQLAHARRGQVAIHAVERSGVLGLEIVAADRGPVHRRRPALALAGPPGPGPAARSLGAGLSGARRAMDEMDIDVRWGEGTCVRARAFAAPVPRRREVGVLGRRLRPSEAAMSGDHAAFARAARRAGDLVAAVIDGIGPRPPQSGDASSAPPWPTFLARHRARARAPRSLCRRATPRCRARAAR